MTIEQALELLPQLAQQEMPSVSLWEAQQIVETIIGAFRDRTERTAADELADLRQRLAAFQREIASEARSREEFGVDVAGGMMRWIAEQIQERFLLPPSVAEPVAAYGEREP